VCLCAYECVCVRVCLCVHAHMLVRVCVFTVNGLTDVYIVAGFAWGGGLSILDKQWS